MTIAIRPATADDAFAVERLYAQSAAYLRSLGDTTDFQFSAAVYLRDGFGPDPAFAGIVAARDSILVGYLLYTFGYDTDRAVRHLFVLDLLVDEASRGSGIGRALMARAAQICHERGGTELIWGVYRGNMAARAFYERLGAQALDDVEFMSLPV
jgi:GNAT superfamily N-acetyltransferase